MVDRLIRKNSIFFAIFWSVFVICSTGLTLWFPEIFTYFFPGELINVATIIHSGKALLAAGFIFTIHFFRTHLRPEKFPMDSVIFLGSYHLEKLKFDRLDEYHQLEESDKIDELIVTEPSNNFREVFSIFGWFDLCTGLILVFFRY